VTTQEVATRSEEEKEYAKIEEKTKYRTRQDRG
jgi:hypothetical protein